MNNTGVSFYQRLKNHFAYSWWKYLILAVVSIGGWNLIYSATAYKPPADRMLTVYIANSGVSSEATEYLSQKALENDPNLEDASVISIAYTESDYYGQMRLTTYMGAGEGDIYILRKDIYDNLVSSGGMVHLDEWIRDSLIDLNGADIQSGYAMDDEGMRAILGLPLTDLYGLMDLGIDNRELMLVVMQFSGNHPAAQRFINWLFTEMKTEKPNWLLEYEEEHAEEITNTFGTASDISSY